MKTFKGNAIRIKILKPKEIGNPDRIIKKMDQRN